MNIEIDKCINANIQWNDLDSHVKKLLGNNINRWTDYIKDYSIKNQLQYEGNLISSLIKKEDVYYNMIIDYSRKNLMIFPYHLSERIIKDMRITPYEYYINMIEDIMTQEKSYDCLPNFTAADCLQIIGIGRNQYIDLLIKYRNNKQKLFWKKPLRALLPEKPLKRNSIQPWWQVHSGYITIDDIKNCSPQEKVIIDQLIAKGSIKIDCLDIKTVDDLFLRGLIYFSQPISSHDKFIIPTLENFVMNRVQGDYMENILYKIFVSIDETTTVEELSKMLEIDLNLVKNAFSLFCWLGLVQRITNEATSSENSSKEHPLNTQDKQVVNNIIWNENDESIPIDVSVPKRIGFIFDSTLTAFLMMGNLSMNLKSHAVTMFEVGKISDQMLESFVNELENVQEGFEGDAQRYYDHAVILAQTIRFFKNTKTLSLNNQEVFNALDLLRCESITSLDFAVCSKMLMNRYQVLITMAPLSHGVLCLRNTDLANYGPPTSFFNTSWAKLFFYHKLSTGLPSIMIPKGSHLHRLPSLFMVSTNLLISSDNQEPCIIHTCNSLHFINQTLVYSTVFLQAVGNCTDEREQCLRIKFPFEPDLLNSQDHKIIAHINNTLELDKSFGYLNFVTTQKNDCSSNDSLDYSSLNSTDWKLSNIHFGLPLFDSNLNKLICKTIIDHDFLSNNKLNENNYFNRKLSLEIYDFILQSQAFIKDDLTALPSKLLYFDGSALKFSFN